MTWDRRCAACGAVVPEGMPDCRSLFHEILAKEFGDYRYGILHRLTVDTYSLQHPEQYMRSGKSFAAHLTGLCAAMESDGPVAIHRAVQRWLSGPKVIPRPEARTRTSRMLGLVRATVSVRSAGAEACPRQARRRRVADRRGQRPPETARPCTT